MASTFWVLFAPGAAVPSVKGHELERLQVGDQACVVLGCTDVRQGPGGMLELTPAAGNPLPGSKGVVRRMYMHPAHILCMMETEAPRSEIGFQAIDG